MKVLELFAGTRSISRAFESHGHETYSVEWDRSFDDITLYDDVNNLTVEKVIELCNGRPDVIWSSPDCTTYSVAAIGYHRKKDANGNLVPQTDYARKCDQTNKFLIELIKEIGPKYWFIENPRGGMRKMDFMQPLTRYTVTYCKYGDKRMKPTDIWTNHPDPQFIAPCKNGDPCHEKSPRGSRCGTQGLGNKRERARIPVALCEHIVDICEKGE